MNRAWILACCLVVGLFHFVNAATYYVSTTGNDSNGDGSQSRPWRTLRYAVSKVPANQGHLIKLSGGTFIEQGAIEIPPQVSIEGAGYSTVLKAASSFYHNPSNPGYSTSRYLLILRSSSATNGNQSIKNLSIDGDGKRLHGGIFVEKRDRVLIEGVHIKYVNFNAIWLWGSRYSRITKSEFNDNAWASTAWCSGNIHLSDLDNVEIDNVRIDEADGYGIKAIGSTGGRISNTKIHDCYITVNPFGLWHNGQAPNITLELFGFYLSNVDIYNNFVDNTISLIRITGETASNSTKTVRVHHNVMDMTGRSKGEGYCLELSLHNAEVDHNHFIGGTRGIANWLTSETLSNWNIHHNVFYGFQGIWPAEGVRSNSPINGMKFINNTFESVGTKTVNVIGLFNGETRNVEIKNNLIINSNTSYSYYPNKFIYLESGKAKISNLTVTNNLLYKLDIGNVAGTYSKNLSIDPQVTKSGDHPDPYYRLKSGSPCIDAGVSMGHAFSGSAPDIGAFEYGNAVAPTNQLPQTSISAPGNNGTFSAGTNLTIKANAGDPDGSITKVEFYNGSTKLGEDATAPYEYTWNNLQEGVYTLTAKAFDNQGASANSAGVKITVVAPANVAPTINLTSPASGASFTAGADITVTANASDTDGTISKVEFYQGTVKLGEDATAPYSFSWADVAAGSYSLTAKATDNQGAEKTSTAIAITVAAPANAAPAVNITSPSNGASFQAGENITLSANATDSDGTISKVEFYQGSVKLGEDTTSPYSFAWPSVAAGAYSITARAIDNDGAQKVSAAISISVTAADNVAPTVTLTGPAAGASFETGADVTLTANAADSDGTVSKVEFYQGSVKLGEDNASPYSFTWTPVAAGTYTLTAKAIDDDGAARTSSSVSITVNSPNVLPSVAITSPANNADFVAGSSVTISASASDSDGSVSKVEFFNGSTKLGEDATAPYSYTWGSVPAGNHSLTARAIDNDGGQKTSAVVAIQVTNPNDLPTVAITSPSNNATYTAGSSVTITATATDADGTITKVEFFNGSSKLGEDTTAPYALSWTNLEPGSYLLTAKATDNQNGTSLSSQVAINVGLAANSLPAVIITSPSNNATLQPGDVPITVQASDNDGTVVRVEFFNGSTKIGEDTTPPFSYTWTGVKAGTYSLTAKAIDNRNGVSSSAATRINVLDPNRVPVVQITNPANNAEFVAGTTVLVQALAADSDGSITKVEFLNGNTLLGTSVASPYTYQWSNLAAGSYVLEAKATDNKGATASAVVNFVVKEKVYVPVANAGPDLTVDLPEKTAVLNGTGESQNGSIVKYEWVQKSGPSAAALETDLGSGEARVSRLEQGTYVFELTITDNKDMVAKDEMTIQVRPSLASLKLPKVFSPNGDGINDTWDWGTEAEYLGDAHLMIFNRFGQKVYETASYSDTWDGSLNGSPLDEDAYYYVISSALGELNGAVRIVR